MAITPKNDIPLGIMRLEFGVTGREQTAVIEVSTLKGYNGGLVSSAQVFWVSPDSRSFMIYGDFSKRVHVSPRGVKATQKALDAQHAEVFTGTAIHQLIDEARAYYATAVAAGVDKYKNAYLAVA